MAPTQKLSGEVEADEIFAGGRVANMNVRKQEKLKAQGRLLRGMAGKAVVNGARKSSPSTTCAEHY